MGIRDTHVCKEDTLLWDVDMGKARKQSLASRKRAKDVSSAMLENTYKPSVRDVQQVEKFDDAAVPRGMRNLMRSIQMVKDAEAGKPVKHYQLFREDTPRPDRPRKGEKGRAHAEGKGGDDVSAPPTVREREDLSVDTRPTEASDPSQGQNMDQSRSHKRPRDGAKVAMASGAGTRSSAGSSAGSGSGRKAAKFGETNNAPPELVLRGHFAKKASASSQERLLAMKREAVLQNYAAAKARGKGAAETIRGGDGSGPMRSFSAPFMSSPSAIF